jgi:hypothetical protein
VPRGYRTIPWNTVAYVQSNSLALVVRRISSLQYCTSGTHRDDTYRTVSMCLKSIQVRSCLAMSTDLLPVGLAWLGHGLARPGQACHVLCLLESTTTRSLKLRGYCMQCTVLHRTVLYSTLQYRVVELGNRKIRRRKLHLLARH